MKLKSRKYKKHLDNLGGRRNLIEKIIQSDYFFDKKKFCKLNMRNRDSIKSVLIRHFAQFFYKL